MAQAGASPPLESPPFTPEMGFHLGATPEPRNYSYTGGGGPAGTPPQTGGEGHAGTPYHTGGEAGSTPFYSPRRLVPEMRASARRRQRDDALEAIQSVSRRGSVRALAASLGASLGAQFNPAAPRPGPNQDCGQGEGGGQGADVGDALGQVSSIDSPVPVRLAREETQLDVSAAASRPKRQEGARPRSRKPARLAVAEVAA
jgi:hypothetical protein